ncbi:hypothetical protein BGZ70_006533, partial [Mortierella alpina]
MFETDSFDQLSSDPSLTVQPAIGGDQRRESSKDRPTKKIMNQGIDSSQDEKCDRPRSPEATDL